MRHTLHPIRIHARIIQHPFAHLMQGARLDSFFETDQDLFLDVQGLQVTAFELFQKEGRNFERATGAYIPLRLHFAKVSEHHCDDFLLNLEKPSHTVIIERDWSPAPPMPHRLVPRPKHLW